MYGIFTYIYHKNQPFMWGKYTMGWYVTMYFTRHVGAGEPSMSRSLWFRQVQSLSRDGVAPCAYQHDQANDPESDGYINESIFLEPK